jgi:hypothetical protein
LKPINKGSKAFQSVNQLKYHLKYDTAGQLYMQNIGELGKEQASQIWISMLILSATLACQQKNQEYRI